MFEGTEATEKEKVLHTSSPPILPATISTIDTTVAPSDATPPADADAAPVPATEAADVAIDEEDKEAAAAAV
jgi:hypothetical protein